MSNRRALALSTMSRPSTRLLLPKYSATIAPIRLSVVAELQRGEEVRQRVWEADLPQDRPLRCRVGAHQLERGLVHLRQPAGHVGHHREEHQDGGHHHLRQRVGQPEPGVEQRREGDDRDGVGGDASGSSTPRADSQRDVANATATPAVVPIASPPSASMIVDRAAGSEREAAARSVGTERRRDRGRPRQDERPQVERRDDQLPGHDRRPRRRGSRAGSRSRPASGGPSREARTAAARLDDPGAADGRHPTAPSAIVRSDRRHAGQVGLVIRVASARPARSASRTSVTSSK